MLHRHLQVGDFEKLQIAFSHASLIQVEFSQFIKLEEIITKHENYYY